MIAGVVPESPEAVARGRKAQCLADVLLAQPALGLAKVDGGMAESAVKGLTPAAWGYLADLAGVRFPSRRTQCLTAVFVRSHMENGS